MTRDQIVRGLAVIRAAFPHQTIPKETIQVYADRLLALPDDPEAFFKAVRQVCDTERFFPPLAAILQAFRDNRSPLKELPEPAVSPEAAAQNRERVRQLRDRLERAFAGRQM